jgi:hypothetical protein
VPVIDLLVELGAGELDALGVDDGRIRAASVARRPSTWSAASITTQSRVISPSFGT